jgi:hypothetical protein
MAVAVTAAPVAVGADFGGFDQVFGTKTNSDLGKKGMNDCGYRETTDAPVLTFEVAAVPKGLTLELADTKSGGVLTLGKRHLCLKPGAISIDDPGTYSVFLLDGPEHPGKLSARLRLFIEGNRKQQLVQGLPMVKLDGTGDNPLLFKRPAVESGSEPGTVGVACAKERIAPIADLLVVQASRFELSAGTNTLYVVSRGACLPASEEAVDLEPGRYTLWMEARGGEVELTIKDLERTVKIAGGKGPVTLTSLPAVTRARVQAGPEADPYADCEIAGRTPAFELDPGSLELVYLSAIGGVKDVRFDVIGEGTRICGKDSVRLEKPRRAYVFLTGEKAGEALIAFTDGKGVAPFWTARELEATAPVPERVVSFVYPFWHTHDSRRPAAQPLFAKAPASLFVFLTKEVKSVPVTEPLLALSNDGKSAVVLRATGEVLEVRAGVLSAEVPPAITMPQVKAPPPSKTTDDAWADAGPLEQARVEAWVKRQDQYLGCVRSFMAKNDPAYGKKYELIYVRSGINVSDVVYAKARASCGEAKFTKDGEAFIKAINASHAKLATTLEASVKKKLGR